jgi:hypothetical protein
MAEVSTNTVNRRTSDLHRTVSGGQSAADFVPVEGRALLSAEDRSRLYGPTGWLTFFRFGALVGGPFAALAFLLTTFGEPSALTVADWLRVGPIALFVLIPTVYGVVAGVQLTKVQPVGVRHARLSMALSLISLMGVVALTATQAGAIAAGQVFGQSVGVLISTPLWLSYFRRSRRVANTYGVQVLRESLPWTPFVAWTVAMSLLVAVPVITLKAFWPSTEGEWRVYAPSTGDFSVDLPGTPVESQELVPMVSGPSLPVQSALLETAEGVAFAVHHFDFTEDTDVNNLEPVLERMRDGSIEASGIVLDSSQRVFSGGLLGLQYIAHTQDKTLTFRGRVFVVGRHGVSLVAVRPSMSSAVPSQAVERFLGSLNPTNP